MLNFDSNGPIIACSTGSKENSAIAIIRISSPDPLNIINDSLDIDLTKAKARYAHFCQLIHRKTKQILDEILLLKFDAPFSYTGEYLIEFHIHGNQLNVERIISYFIQEYGFEFARAGEFSYRAHKNKKLDTIQLEGLEQFLNATNSFALNQGLSGLNGELYKEYQNLKNCYFELRAAIEMGIDFIDDMGEEQFNKLLGERSDNFSRLLGQFYRRTKTKYSSLLNPSITLVGSPNAGKSTFFNNFLKFDRSIVSNTPGTTRDMVSEYIEIEGNNFKLVDTAGIREASDDIEREGVKRALNELENSFFKIQVLNILDKNEQFSIQNNIDLLVLSHCDCEGFDSELRSFINKNSNLPIFTLANSGGPIGPIWDNKSGPIEPDRVLKSGPIGPKQQDGPIEPECNSNNFKYLDDIIHQKFNKIIAENPISSQRQQILIEKTYIEWDKIINNKSLVADITLFSHEFNRLGPFLDELLGVATPDNVLNHVFSNFCIGK